MYNIFTESTEHILFLLTWGKPGASALRVESEKIRARWFSESDQLKLNVCHFALKTVFITTSRRSTNYDGLRILSITTPIQSMDVVRGDKGSERRGTTSLQS